MEAFRCVYVVNSSVVSILGSFIISSISINISSFLIKRWIMVFLYSSTPEISSFPPFQHFSGVPIFKIFQLFLDWYGYLKSLSYSLSVFVGWGGEKRNGIVIDENRCDADEVIPWFNNIILYYYYYYSYRRRETKSESE